ncbi:MAG TPA: nuclease-related domain-containing protein [Woeseiaceae bacterium]|nr:nuclease-related domain-containing protein [Woeseiaceae bacterium]
MAASRKSPIKANPLRQPGQSIREEQLDLLFDKLFPLGTMLLLLWLMAGLEWIWLLNGVKPDPVHLTVFAALLTVYGGLRSYPLLRKLKHLRTGYKGERAVGEYLDRLRVFGYRVYHDIPGESGNIDHVIISTRGIYTIETKTRSKPAKGQCKILYDGEAVSINGGPADPSPIIQARAQGAQLTRLLKELTGRRLAVRPLVLYPGWYVEHTEAAGRSAVRVLSAKGLYKWIEREPETVPAEAVRHAASQLGAFIRRTK